jgi:hypothetical protein
MTNFNSEEDVGRLLKAVYGPVVPPPEVRAGVLERLTLEASRVSSTASRPPWERPRLLVPILVALISGLIGYGSWLSLHLVPTLLP